MILRRRQEGRAKDIFTHSRSHNFVCVCVCACVCVCVRSFTQDDMHEHMVHQVLSNKTLDDEFSAFVRSLQGVSACELENAHVSACR